VDYDGIIEAWRIARSHPSCRLTPTLCTPCAWIVDRAHPEQQPLDGSPAHDDDSLSIALSAQVECRERWIG
jgi:hypothetical protein